MTEIKRAKYVNLSYAAFIISAVALLSLSLLSFLRFEQQKNASELVSHTFQVKLEIEHIAGALIEAESNQRAFLYSHDSSYIGNFEESGEKFGKTMAVLDSLIIDNPVQGENASYLQNLGVRRLNRMKIVMDSATSVFDKSGRSILLPGKMIMDTIQVQLRKMSTIEDQLLNDRINEKKKSDRVTSQFIFLLSIISLGILLFSFFRLRSESIRRARAEIDVSVLEAKVKERTAEIKKINELLIAQNQELERRNAELASFTFMASHDLKEPLRKIETFSDRIMQTELEHFSERSKDYFDRILVSTRRMQSLIDAVFLYAGTNISNPDFRKTDLNKTVAGALETLHERITEKKAVITFSNLPTVDMIPEQMEQLFTNLLENAIKYSRPDTTPQIRISVQDLPAEEIDNPLNRKAWRIDFTDNGIGFDERYLSKIFQIFQRLHPKEAYSGTGIGLAICKKIMENHDGLVTASSTPGMGSVFSIFLPVQQTGKPNNFTS